MISDEEIEGKAWESEKIARTEIERFHIRLHGEGLAKWARDETMKRMKEREQKLVDALEFYADGQGGGFRDTEHAGYSLGLPKYKKGLIAREALKEYREMEREYYDAWDEEIVEGKK